MLGNYILSKLICKVYNGICDDIEVKDILCWSDSQISLAWIKDFKTFVQNRLVVIRNNVHPDNWKYCSTNENPADIITKIKMCDISTNNPMDTSSSIRHRFDVEIPRGKFVEITSILKGESMWKL